MKRIVCTAGLLGLILGFCSMTSHATTITLTATNGSNNNYGHVSDAGTLQLGGAAVTGYQSVNVQTSYDERSLFNFDLSGIAAGTVITSATLYYPTIEFAPGPFSYSYPYLGQDAGKNQRAYQLDFVSFGSNSANELALFQTGSTQSQLLDAYNNFTSQTSLLKQFDLSTIDVLSSTTAFYALPLVFDANALLDLSGSLGTGSYAIGSYIPSNPYQVYIGLAGTVSNRVTSYSRPYLVLTTNDVAPNPNNVDEPSTLALFVSGFGFGAWVRRRHSRRH